MWEENIYDVNFIEPAQVTMSEQTDVGAGIKSLGEIKHAFKGGDDFEIWTATTSGVKLVEGMDYKLLNLDVGYTKQAGFEIYTSYQILNPHYQTGNIYINYKVIASYAVAALFNQLKEAAGETKKAIEEIKTAGIPGLIPIGSIVAWHKTMTGVSVLGENFLECDGSLITDQESPLCGENLPNLNGTGRFLRGSSTSGATQDHAIGPHFHKIIMTNGAQAITPYSPGSSNHPPTSPGNGSADWTELTATVIIAGNTDTETRPINMSVVWIMRIK